MDINLLVKLTARAWALDILAAIHLGTPGRQAPLLTATGAGRTAFAQSLGHLIELDLIERNPGHGHPLRPEFRLTAQGHVAAAMAARVLGRAKTGKALLRRRWSLPVLAQTGAAVPFSGLSSALAPVTDRALSQSIKLLSQENWLARDVDATQMPPRAYYRAINQGAQINQLLAQG